MILIKNIKQIHQMNSLEFSLIKQLLHFFLQKLQINMLKII